MRKQLSVIFATLASMLLIFVILFTAVEVGISDSTFIKNEYTKLQLSKDMGMNNTDLVNSCLKLISYMKGESDSIDIMVTVNGEKTLMFDQEQEVVHMKDCRTLYLTIKQYRDYAVFGAVILYVLAFLLSLKVGPLHSVAKGYISGGFIMALLLGFIGTWAALDFSSFWTAFHQSLFWNDLWMFDTSTSRMINMLPEQFFADIVSKIVILAAIAIVFLMIAAIVIVVSYNKKRRREEEEAEKRAQKHRKKRRKALEEKTETVSEEEIPGTEE